MAGCSDTYRDLADSKDTVIEDLVEAKDNFIDSFAETTDRRRQKKNCYSAVDM